MFGILEKRLKIATYRAWIQLLCKSPDDSGRVRKVKELEIRLALIEGRMQDYYVLCARSKGVKVGQGCRLFSDRFLSEPYLVKIGDNVIVSSGVTFLTHDGSTHLFHDEDHRHMGSYGRITVGNNCFNGMNSIILPNVTIGNDCIVAAGAVIGASFPDNSVIAGNPAKTVFKTSVLRKIKLSHKHTVTHPDWKHPKPVPPEIKRAILEQHFYGDASDNLN